MSNGEINCPYEDFVDGLMKDMGSEAANLMHSGIGIAGEAGEILDALKKHWVYNKPLDRDNLIEELGDIFFYMQSLANQLGVSWAYIISNNRDKLRKRYPNGYTNKAAQERKDKCIISEYRVGPNDK